MRTLVKKLDTNARLAPAILGRAPSFAVAAGALADALHEVALSNGETVHLHLPPHTHLNPGDVLLDSMGMMVRVDAARQPVLAVRHADVGAMVSLALAAAKQGRAIGFADGALLLDLDAALEAKLGEQGYALAEVMGHLTMPAMALPLPADCGHGHGHNHGAHAEKHDHGHSHDHGHGHSH